MNKIVINPEKKIISGVTTKRELRGQFTELKEFMQRIEQ